MPPGSAGNCGGIAARAILFMLLRARLCRKDAGAASLEGRRLPLEASGLKGRLVEEEVRRPGDVAPDHVGGGPMNGGGVASHGGRLGVGGDADLGLGMRMGGSG